MKPLLFFLLLALVPFYSSGQLTQDELNCLELYCLTDLPFSCSDPNNPTGGEYCVFYSYWSLMASYGQDFSVCDPSMELTLYMACPELGGRTAEDPELKKVMDEVVSIHKSDLSDVKKKQKIQSKIQQFEENNPETASALKRQMSLFTRYPESYPDLTPVTEEQVLKFMELQREAYSVFDPKYQEAPALERTKKEKKERNN